MSNRFAGPCYRCGKRVDVGDGHLERFGGRWRVQHATCAIQYRGQPDPLRAQYQRARDERLAQSTGKAAQNARRRIRDREKAESLARMKGNDMAMTRLDYRNAAAETLALARKIGHDGCRPTLTPAADYPHLVDMSASMIFNDGMSLEKLGRWLGWMQGCVYVMAGGALSLDDFKAINMRNSDNARKGEAPVAVPVAAAKMPTLDEIAKAISGVGYPEHVAGDGFAWWWHPHYDDPANVLTHESREEDREKARRVLALFGKTACQPPAAPVGERDAFEAAYAKFCEVDLEAILSWRDDSFGTETYRNSHTHAAWIGWKLARSKAVGETQEAFADGYVCGQGEGVEIARHAYEAHDRTNRDWVRDSLWDKLNLEGTARVEAARNRIGGQPLAASVDDLSNALKAIVNGAPDGMERGRAALARASRRRA